ncbi:KAP family NTPase [Tenacibaculum haliotis]|uniref:KAP family NTPase n=1 Tax=Tenacibaculum haliotis TaxID=1888914 RepID=UPI0021AF0341|nr:KAP family NTPase [Tenacibaculum haliotis]MCT4698224.1 KAP family NTPase [Tenacibaculum haliotis]
MKIDITSEIERFENHLNQDDNNQMIFSGIFGIGKTYFLKEFFEQNSDKYELFLLSPVNYSISNNDDIIDYIKYDIAFELLGKNVDYEKTDFSKLLTAQFYLKDNFLDTMSLLAKSGGKIGKAFSDVYENLKKLVNNIKEHNSESQIDEKKELIDFLKELTARDNSIYEENRITELISGLIEKLKENDKEIVLVIDDLDRLDPEHIFRILNVFACHFDIGNFTENKFGFHKIILVCDIENIRNLFHSKYGTNVDFSGYIDKFYSREIHYFDNKEIVSKSVDKILSSIKIQGAYDHIINLKNRNRTTTVNFQEILEDLINNDLLNLRTLLKLFDKEYHLKFFDFVIDENYGRSSSWHFQKILVFDFLISFYGSITSLRLALDKLVERNPTKVVNDRQLRRYGNLIALIDYKNHKTAEGDFEYVNADLNISIKYSAIRYGDWGDETSANIKEVTYLDKSETKRLDFPFASLLKIAFEEYLNLTRVKN